MKWLNRKVYQKAWEKQSNLMINKRSSLLWWLPTFKVLKVLCFLIRDFLALLKIKIELKIVQLLEKVWGLKMKEWKEQIIFLWEKMDLLKTILLLLKEATLHQVSSKCSKNYFKQRRKLVKKTCTSQLQYAKTEYGEEIWSILSTVNPFSSE